MQRFSSVARSCPTLCDPMDCSTPGLPAHHQLPELTQTHVHWVGDAIQPPYPLSSPSPLPSIFPSIRVFPNVNTLHQVATVLELQLPHQSFQWIIRTDFLYNWPVWSSYCPRGSQESSWAPPFKRINYSALSLLYGPTLASVHDYWKDHSFD